jgi:hypothetical protein
MPAILFRGQAHNVTDAEYWALANIGAESWSRLSHAWENDAQEQLRQRQSQRQLQSAQQSRQPTQRRSSVPVEEQIDAARKSAIADIAKSRGQTEW